VSINERKLNRYETKKAMQIEAIMKRTTR